MQLKDQEKRTVMTLDYCQFDSDFSGIFLMQSTSSKATNSSSIMLYQLITDFVTYHLEQF